MSVVFTFPKVEGFDANWNNFLARKQLSRTGRREEGEGQEGQVRGAKKSVRNPTPIEPMEEEE